MKTFLVGNKYSCISFTVDASTTNYDVLDNNPELFEIISSGKAMLLQTSQAISVKINNTSNDSISITSTENTVGFPMYGIENIFITTGLSASNIQIVLLG